MKRILITGKNSYIGQTFINWVKANNVDYKIDTIDLKDPDWKKQDFSIYDCLIHLAAIVHKKGQEDDIYYRVNRDLAVETAQKAKDEGIKQFVFFSTMSVYDKNSVVVSSHTKPAPNNAYGKSKLEAEKLIYRLMTPEFIVSILRPPMIYGYNSPGNYRRISSLAQRVFVFPKIENKRSMLFIENLHSFLKLIIDNKLSGYYFPQNEELVNTSNLVKQIALKNNKKIYLIPGFKWIIDFLEKKIELFSKVFGSFYYDSTLSGSPGTEEGNIKFLYQEKSFKESIRASEK
ncbi:NAD-dependent epimerase/dehydratase family protein [Tetragenococcus halophilus]|uniref:NAD-dependent epimerase/dehydratase family protein n=1 Tax=Tetragenococcus halophilus TaxID=51669 RepID=UPI001F3021AC|nr:NAD-dependent epimerase/dehydratase family protein [Tetragenococcus halophilus]MCF1685043.1 NAD-dependent epimerase/dehydratase family protein [Tetragenococcus halophilus]